MKNIYFHSLTKCFPLSLHYTVKVTFNLNDVREPEYYFVVARQPDIVNTAVLNGARVTHDITVRVIQNSIATETVEFGVDVTSPLRPSDIGGLNCVSLDQDALVIGESIIMQLDPV